VFVCLREDVQTPKSEFIKWFKVQVTQRCGPLSARQTDQNVLIFFNLFCKINLFLLPVWETHPICLCLVLFHYRLHLTCFTSPCKHVAVSLNIQLSLFPVLTLHTNACSLQKGVYKLCISTMHKCVIKGNIKPSTVHQRLI